MKFPQTRMRRLRVDATMRQLVGETVVLREKLIMPLFTCCGSNIVNPINSMPGQYQMSVDKLIEKCKQLRDQGIKSILLFGIPDHKDETGDCAAHDHAIIPTAVRAIKKEVPELFVIADVCNCEYTLHGHCGTIVNGYVDNDSTLETLARQCVAFANAGVDCVAPSDMMDGRIGFIRNKLDAANFVNLPIMAYSAKYASAFYGPFRDAADSAPKFGDRKTYQMDPANVYEALNEIALDIDEGADIVMVKPALSYLDVISRARAAFNTPLCAYNVSGEYSMVKAAALSGWVDEQRIVSEILTSITRAGADMIITYHAEDAVKWNIVR